MRRASTCSRARRLRGPSWIGSPSPTAYGTRGRPWSARKGTSRRHGRPAPWTSSTPTGTPSSAATAPGGWPSFVGSSSWAWAQFDEN
eukprot:10562027-Lingulodinium_polyedra.AAC.1